MMARPTYEEMIAGLTDEQIQETFNPLNHEGSCLSYQYWGG